MTTPDPQERERAIRLRTGLVVLSPQERGYRDWADIRHLLHLLDEERARRTAATREEPPCPA